MVSRTLMSAWFGPVLWIVPDAVLVNISAGGAGCAVDPAVPVELPGARVGHVGALVEPTG